MSKPSNEQIVDIEGSTNEYVITAKDTDWPNGRYVVLHAGMDINGSAVILDYEIKGLRGEYVDEFLELYQTAIDGVRDWLKDHSRSGNTIDRQAEIIRKKIAGDGSHGPTQLQW